MLILGIDTSAVNASFALCETSPQRIILSGNINNKMTHSQTLMPLMESLLKSADIKLSDVDAFAVSVGPGSFTGLRIGISTIKGLAFALNKPCFAVSTLKALAYNLTLQNGIVCAAMDARCKQVYTALFKITDGKVERLTEDNAIMIGELSEIINKYNEKITLVGDGAELVFKELQNPLLKLAPPNLIFQNAASACFATETEKQISPKELMPKYLRLPQAEREKIERNK